MPLDPDWIKKAAAEWGWVARDTEFEPEITVKSGAGTGSRSWFSQIFSLSRDPFSRRPSDAGGPILDRKDWRDFGVIIPPGHQHDVNACVSFAACALADARARILGKHPNPLAPFHLHFCDMHRALGSGADMWLLAETALSPGLPYAVNGTDSLRDKKSCDAVTKPPRMPISAVYTFETAEQVKREIALHGPVMCLMDLHEDFQRWYGSGVYRPTSNGTSLLHSVCLIGYNDAGGYWIGKNSYGIDWGVAGFFLIAYDSCGVLTSGTPLYSMDLF